MSQEKNNNLYKTLKLKLSLEEYNYIQGQANQQRSTIQSYCRNKLLDDRLGVKLLGDRIMQLMPQFYILVSEISDPVLQKKLTDLGGKICQYLK